MNALNKVFLAGQLAEDPEVHYRPNGTPVAKFVVSTTRRWDDALTGQPRERTNSNRVTMWGRQGEAVARRLSAGTCVLVEGRLDSGRIEAKRILPLGLPPTTQRRVEAANAAPRAPQPSVAS